MHLSRLIVVSLIAACLSQHGVAADDLPILFEEDFEKDASHWQPFDAKQWAHKKTDKGGVLSQHNKETTYKPPHRSPTNVALLKDVVAGDFDLTAKVLSTHPDYGHRDAVLV